MTSPGLLSPPCGEVDPQALDLTPPRDAKPRDPARARRVRLAFVAATVSTFIALSSHVLGGGSMPGPLGVLFPLALAVLACLLFARVRTDALRLALSVGASQFFFHTLFVLGTPTASTHGSPSTTAVGAHTGHALHGSAAASSAMADYASSVAAAGPSAHLTHDAPLMWVMHALAAALTATALFFGEVLLASLATAKDAAATLLPPRLRHAFLLLARTVRPRVVGEVAPLELPWVPALTDRVERTQRRRGPPARAGLPALTTSNELAVRGPRPLSLAQA